ncbi:anti-sigma factor [Microbacterium cremeum]|uniref:anti-sigma factor n=1 Tax=Microbacterium cremeum TaxID=2782169 RepID=UPI001888E47D|nr:anti-sigma factor [Microbacterium cremeum]
MTEEEFAELAAGHALNALSPADRVAFEAERVRHPEWEHWISAFVATAATLADGVEDQVPPPAIRAGLLARIGAEPQLPGGEHSAAAEGADPAAQAPAPDAPNPAGDPTDLPADRASSVAPPPTTEQLQAVTRRNWTRGLVALAASLVLLIGIGFGAATIVDLVDRPPAVVALDQIEAAPDAASATVEVTGGGTATAHWAPSVGKVVLVANGLPRIPEDDVFELWWVRGERPVSAGTFEAGADGASTVLLDGEWQADDIVAVTVEPDGGAPDGVPTTEPIVAIPTT